jgi:hypothetical protein
MVGMKCPFPGMDPWLEQPSLWPDVHNRLVAAVSDALTPLVAPRYYVALERRTYLLQPDDLVLVGRPDVAVVSRSPRRPAAPKDEVVGVLDVEVRLSDEVGENYLEIRDVETESLVTVLELLSPGNKLHAKGREDYERKRSYILDSLSSLVEIDLLRAGEPMPVSPRPPPSDYRMLVSRGWMRPKGRLYTFGLRDPIPALPIPLAKGEDEPELRLNEVLHALYERARFDLRLHYERPPAPPLADEDAEWARQRVAAASRPR